MNRIQGVCVLGLLAAAPLASAQGAEGYAYPYFDELVPLELDASTIVLIDDHAAAGDGAFRAKVGTFGFADAGLRAHAQPHTYLAEAPDFLAAGGAGGGGVRDMVDALAAEHAADFVSPMFLDHRGEPMWITNGLTVKFVEGVTPDQAAGVVAGVIGSTLVASDWSRMERTHRFTTDSRNGFEVLEASRVLGGHALVEYAEPDMVLTLRQDLIPNDPFFSFLWGIRNTGQNGGNPNADMNGDLAWDHTTGDADIKVLILDDGIQQNHPDINQLAGVDFTGNGTGGGPATECDNHGTTVAGCVSATINNSQGVVGIAPACRVLAGKFSISNPPCDGGGTFSPVALVNTIEWGLNNGAKVSNNSNSLGISASVTSKYSTSRTEGMIHFASTGNDGQGSINYPSSLPTVNAVGAITRFGGKASFSNSGDGIDFTAPGQEVTTTDRTGSDGFQNGNVFTTNGTSYASPYAAGVAALVLSVNGSLTPVQVEDILEQTAKDFGPAGYDTSFGFGVPNADAAVEMAIGQLVLPGPFNILAPTNGSVDQPLDVQFAWLKPSGVESFIVTIDNNADFSSPVLTANVSPSAGPVTSYLPNPPLAEDTVYFAKVAAKNAAGQTLGSPNVIQFTTEVGCLGDTTGDGAVNSEDLNLLLAVFGTSNASGDLNNDGAVNSSDLNVLLANFGATCN